MHTDESKPLQAPFPPPRKISSVIKIALFLGGFSQMFWILGALFFTLGFASHYDARGIDDIDDGNYRKTIGKVEHTYSYHEDHRSYYGMNYSYYVAGEQYQDSCETKIPFGEHNGSEIGIHYSKKYPERGVAKTIPGCHLEGKGSRNIFMGLGGLMAFLILFQFFRGIYHLHLLKNGSFTGAVLEKHTHESDNREDEFKNHELIFQYYAPETRQEYRLVINTRFSKAITDDPEEGLLYLPYNPKRAALIDGMNGSLQIKENGEIVPEHSGAALLLIAPVLAIISPITGYLFYMIW